MIKRIIILGTSLFLTTNLFSQPNLDDTEKLASLCKVWGFLKYYHPVVAKGKLDWDNEFIDHYNKIISIQDRESLNRFYIDWIASLGKIKECKKCKQVTYNDSIIDSKSTDWFNDKLFSDSVTSILNYIKENKNFSKNYYVNYVIHGQFFGNTPYPNEKPYPDSIFPKSEAMRMLCLARHWNIINYYFPYKNVIGENWNNVLERMIPKFIHANDSTTYHFTLMEMVASTHDTHSWFLPSPNDFGSYFFPFKTKIIENKLVVTHLENDSLAAIDNIKVGDAITSIGSKTVSEMIDISGKYLSASNDASKKDNTSYIFRRGTSDTVTITFERNGIKETKVLHRYFEKDLKRPPEEKPQSDNYLPWKVIQNNIGYVDMGLLKPKQVKQMMKDFLQTKAIIFDIRNYPDDIEDEIAKYLNKERKPFVKFTYPTITYPGIFKFLSPELCGSNNQNYYKGKVILLFNEETQSHAEFACMALQTAPNVTCIGSQTAGADGNIVEITLPGNYTFYMSGIGVYYPDGRETQRIGIVPDIEVKPTIKGILNKKDEVLDRAIEFIKTGK